MNKITYIFGPMRSGKTELLIEKIQYFKNTNCEVIVMKPSADTRDIGYIRSRAKNIEIHSNLINTLGTVINVFDTIVQLPKDREVNIFVDEIHFLDESTLSSIISCYYNMFSEFKNINLYLCGLQYSFKHEEFETHYIAKNHANTIIEVQGTCEECRGEFSKYNCLFKDGKMTTDGDVYNPGDTEYKALCEDCKNFKKIC